MHQFELKVWPCDHMPEYVVACQKLKNGNELDDDQRDLQAGSQIEYVEVEVVMDGDFNEDGTCTCEPQSHLKEPSLEQNDESETISNDVGAAVIETVAIEQTDDIEVPSPAIEPHDAPVPIGTEQMLLECRKQLAIRNEQLQTHYKPEIERLKGIINANQATIAHHVEDKNRLRAKIEEMKSGQVELQNEIERLKMCLLAKDAEHKKAQLINATKMKMAIEATKMKQWCVNCQSEALITQYKLPVCSTDCLFTVL